MSNEVKLALLRVQLFTAVHELQGDDAEAFWDLIDDVQQVRVLSKPPTGPTIRPPLPPRSSEPPAPPRARP